MSITDFLNARITEDEEQAETCRKLGWFPASKYEMHAVSHARVLAECAAKRAIVDVYTTTTKTQGALAVKGMETACEIVVKCLAEVYSDHPEYRDEWRVGA